MMQYLVTCLFFICFGIVTAPAGAQDTKTIEDSPAEDSVTVILRQWVDDYRQSVGIVVGVMDGLQRTTYSYGTLNRSTIRKVSNATTFEIGAVTGAMTGVLLAHMVEKGEVSLSDPVSNFLPLNVRMPTRSGRLITLEHLATHTSGLPYLPGDLRPEDPQNPLAGYTVERLYAFLSNHTLSRDIGTYEYSELGMALLGHVLALKAGKPYEDLLVERIFTPLNMPNTRVTLTPSMKIQMATGHDPVRLPVAPSATPLLAGANGIRSNVHDLMIFVSAAMGVVYALPTFQNRADAAAFISAFDTANQPRHRADRDNEDVALGWKVRKFDDREIHWQHGKTRGFSSFVGYDRERRLGVVVLSNTTNRIDDIGFYLLAPEYPLASPPQIAPTAGDPALYEAYAGVYQFASDVTVHIFTDGTRLYGQPSGQARSELFPESDRVFYLKEEDARITFMRDETGQVTHLLFLKNGQTHRADKVQ